MQYTKSQVKNFAISHTLFPQTSLKNAVEKLKFVQIDPIKSPATAQDLILRHRVKNYNLGDIDLEYKSLNLEEDFLYAHGYLTHEIWQLLHPRQTIILTPFDQQVLEKVKLFDEITPQELRLHFESKKEKNWWGGNSQASRMSLERLHYYGLLRVVRRQNGVRIYQAFSPPSHELPLEERLSKIIMTIVEIMAPVSNKTLAQSLHRIHRHFGSTRPIIKHLLKCELLQNQIIDGVEYIWPSGVLIENEIPQTIKFLAPFDPVVRDRIRFEHFWGWKYQFEAYTPASKRIRGYYAMPILWENEMVGWANVKKLKEALDFDLSFINTRPKTKQFNKQLEMEVSRIKYLLQKNA